MFRSLHTKLVLILIVLIVSVMAVVGTFLVNSIGSYYLDSFQEQIYTVFNGEVLRALDEVSDQPDALEQIDDVLSAYEGQLGIDNYRNYYVLDGNGNYLIGSSEAFGSELGRTDNIITAMAGAVGNDSVVMDTYMDYAIPLGDPVSYIIYIVDDKQEIQDLSLRFFGIVMQAMFFGLLVAVLLSFLLSKTITTPIEHIKNRAQLVASGDFSHRLEIQSGDEIGELTRTFNYMADKLHNTLGEVEGERDKLNTLFLHMTDGVAAFDSQARLIHMNPAAENMLQVKFSPTLQFEDAFADLSFDAFAIRDGQYTETELQITDRTLAVLFAPFGVSDGERGTIVVIHDITEQRKLDDARREFVANVSHELRTPLTNIKSYTETLTDAAGELPPETEVRFLNVISSEADRMTRIVKDLLTLSKLDYGRMDLHFSEFPLQTMLENLYSAMMLQSARSGHNLKLDMPEPLPDMVGDRERLEQVVVNILSNAIKYTPSGGKILLRATMNDARHVQIQVCDNGMGIPEADIPRLFERFYRVDKARSREKGGSGLGLAIAKEMVEAHRGTIRLSSVVEQGTEVTIVLPIDLKAEQT